MKRILVTGGAGFLGSNLCERLVRDEGSYVYCLDNLTTGRRSNVRELEELPNFRLVIQDIREPFWLEVDEIYNAACPASPPAYQKSPTNTTKTCVYGAVNMLQLARESGARMLQFSTSEVYGDPCVSPQPESYRGNVNPDGIRSCYDEGKRCAESLCFDYHREFGVRVKVIRIFNTYGPGMDPEDGRVVSNFIVQALKGEDLTVYGDGSQTRSFCYVTDLIDGILRMMESPDDFLGPVNLGNPGEFTVLELAQMVLELTGRGGGIVHRPLPEDDPLQRRPDITLAKERLGWEPKVGLREGLKRTIGYFAGLNGVG